MSSPKAASCSGDGRKTRLPASRRPPRQRARNLRAEHKRASQAQFVARFSLPSLRPLPLPLPCPLELPTSPRKVLRSCYRPRSRGQIRRFFAHLKARASRSPDLFLLSLHLLDLSAWRPLLLHLTTRPSARGEVPFDPLSLLLACLWKIAYNLPWNKAAATLADAEKGRPWRRRFGFSDQDTPSEATLRAFRQRLPDGLLNYLQKLFLAALDEAGLLPDPQATQGYLLVGDGQRHQARSQHRCHHAQASCFEPTTAEHPRPCPARQKSQGHYFCDCDTPACQPRCALAPRLDRQAACSVYDRAKQTPPQETAAAPPAAPRSFKDVVWGYRSLASRMVDTALHVAWNVYSACLPANVDEGSCFPAHISAVHANLPHKQLGYVIYDAACGEMSCLNAVYELGGIPLFDLQRHSSDDDVDKCKQRGYDKHGHLLCALGFPMTYQGLDRSRRRPRARWVCLHACRQSQAGEVPLCPYLQHKKGQYRYLERAFDNDSARLARLVPYGTRSWKKLTAWRNTAEGRNAALEGRGLKRLPDYGLQHVTFLVIGADIVENCCTLARLVYQATWLDERFQPRSVSPGLSRIPMPAPATAPEPSGGSPAQEVEPPG
jgi:hypothetical protein